ncbi:MAG: toll/interleukin-1 receptor domain-containing protein [Desulfobulbus sp.]|nr:toll/interleukin-1 receptor domain-containing protein [Desulfobulbus sp.]
MSLKKKVFVSYSWDVDKDTQIVDELAPFCPPRGIDLLYDRKVMKHGDSIRKFMDQLAGGEHIITIFSDAYFRSKWCMFELLTISKRDGFSARTHAILIDGCKPWDVQYRLNVVDFWKDEYATLKKQLAPQKPDDVVDEFALLKMIREIQQETDSLLHLVADGNITRLEDLKAENYAPLLDTIALKGDPQQQKDNQEEATVEEENWREQDEIFLSEIATAIERNLATLPSLIECLKAYIPATIQNHPSELALWLIKECQQGRFEQVVHHLYAAYVDCKDSIEESKPKALVKLQGNVRDLVAMLVLFNVVPEWIGHARERHANNGGKEWVLPKISQVGAKVALARQNRILPAFQRTVSITPKGLAFVNDAFSLEGGIKKESVLKFALKNMASVLLQMGEFDEHTTTSELAGHINDAIGFWKKGDSWKTRKHYFVLIPFEGSNSPLVDPEVQNQLRQLLPELDWVSLTVGDQIEVFLIPDNKLMTALSQFLKVIEQE